MRHEPEATSFDSFIDKALGELETSEKKENAQTGDENSLLDSTSADLGNFESLLQEHLFNVLRVQHAYY